MTLCRKITIIISVETWHTERGLRYDREKDFKATQTGEANARTTCQKDWCKSLCSNCVGTWQGEPEGRYFKGTIESTEL